MTSVYYLDKYLKGRRASTQISFLLSGIRHRCRMEDQMARQQ